MSVRRRSPATSAEGETIASFFATERPVGHLLSLLAARYERAFLEQLATGRRGDVISAAEHAVLRCVSQAPATSTEIARMLGVSKQAIGRTVGGLVQRGYVRRGQHKADLRAQVVSMTALGRQLEVRSIRAAITLDARTAKVLGRKDLAVLKALLTRVVEERSIVSEP